MTTSAALTTGIAVAGPELARIMMRIIKISKKSRKFEHQASRDQRASEEERGMAGKDRTGGRGGWMDG